MPDDLSTTWTDVDGVEHTITTPRSQGSEFHRMAVAAAQGAFPPQAQ
jgi:hypothetical protein